MGSTHLHNPPFSIFSYPGTSGNAPAVQHDATTSSAWSSMPPVPPISMPWSLPSLRQQPDLVRFTGQEAAIGPFRQSYRSFKRRLEAPDIVDTRPAKEFITEEKMALHFKELQITSSALNSTNSTVPIASTSNANLDPIQTCDLDLESSNLLETGAASCEPRLVISEELKKLTEEPIIPASLLSKMERPTMALVLWEPPCKHLGSSPSEDSPVPSVSDNNNDDDMNADDGNNNNNNGSVNNNNETIPNFNETVAVNNVDPDLEPMDL